MGGADFGSARWREARGPKGHAQPHFGRSCKHGCLETQDLYPGQGVAHSDAPQITLLAADKASYIQTHKGVKS
jgi:hypothetical protein